MEKEFKTIYGVIGEVIEPFVSVTKSENEERHAVVGMEVDGFVMNEDGTITLLVSPEEAITLSNEIRKAADEANIVNYNLLTHKAPF